MVLFRLELGKRWHYLNLLFIPTSACWLRFLLLLKRIKRPRKKERNQDKSYRNSSRPEAAILKHIRTEFVSFLKQQRDGYPRYFQNKFPDQIKQKHQQQNHPFISISPIVEFDNCPIRCASPNKKNPKKKTKFLKQFYPVLIAELMSISAPKKRVFGNQKNQKKKTKKKIFFFFKSNKKNGSNSPGINHVRSVDFIIPSRTTFPFWSKTFFLIDRAFLGFLSNFIGWWITSRRPHGQRVSINS